MTGASAVHAPLSISVDLRTWSTLPQPTPHNSPPLPSFFTLQRPTSLSSCFHSLVFAIGVSRWFFFFFGFVTLMPFFLRRMFFFLPFYPGPETIDDVKPGFLLTLFSSV